MLVNKSFCILSLYYPYTTYIHKCLALLKNIFFGHPVLTISTSWPGNVRLLLKGIVCSTSDGIVPSVEISSKSVVVCSSITGVHY